jgi:nitroimidazol reductase NimA-like FMN-containing flavoprotein (pyridoxamine 5'-phosphate oxidase superfamily)
MTEHDRLGPNERTRVRRQPARGVYDREMIYGILDEALICHVGFVADGFPHVIPMVVVRKGDDLLLHGSAASRLVRLLGTGADVCVSVTHLDGVIVARSVFDSSMNYRSVSVFGRARAITRSDEKLEALRTVVEHVLPGRWQEARQPSDKELRATTILALPLEKASAKVRSGPPQDDEADLDLPVWAGEIPVRMVSLEPLRDPLGNREMSVPESIRRFRAARVPAVEDAVAH